MPKVTEKGWIPETAVAGEPVIALAKRVFGDPTKADRWLREPKQSLGGRTPLEIIDDEVGEQRVREMLYRIEHGMFA